MKNKFRSIKLKIMKLLNRTIKRSKLPSRMMKPMTNRKNRKL